MTEQNDEPQLLQAVEFVLADPADIKREVLALKREFDRKYCDSKPESQINKMLADKIISNYSYYAAFVGGATGLTGVVPGLGTVLATFGGGEQWPTQLCR